MVLEESTKKAYESVYASQPCGTLLTGPYGTGKAKIARLLAAHWLECECVEAHPDYEELDTTKDASVDAIRSILEFVSTYPVKAKKKIVLIDGIDRLSKEGANALLKCMEESKHAIFLATASGPVLATIESRLKLLPVNPLPYDLFKEVHKDADELTYFLCAGCPERLSMVEQDKALYEKVADAIQTHKEITLFSMLNLVKEKDENNFFVTHTRDCVSALLSMVESIITKRMEETHNATDAQAVILLQKEIVVCRYKTYTKDDFFLCIMRLYETYAAFGSGKDRL